MSEELPVARDHISDAYDQCLSARRQYIRGRNATTDTNVAERLHENLHTSVLEYYEALHPVLSKQDGMVKEYWTSAPLWQDGYQYEDAIGCQQCDTIYDNHDRHEPCPDCGAILEEIAVVAHDEHGNPKPRWVCGLKSLEDSFVQTTTETKEVTGSLGTYTKTEKKTQRFAPPILFRIARYLDQCLEELDLHVETSDTQPPAKIGDPA